MINKKCQRSGQRDSTVKYYKEFGMWLCRPCVSVLRKARPLPKSKGIKLKAVCKLCEKNRSHEGDFEYVIYGDDANYLVCSACASAIKEGKEFLRMPEWRQQRIMQTVMFYARVAYEKEHPDYSCYGMGQD